ncbi:Cytochrome oxidase maturation protein cbb3-type [Pseudovibrio sp. W64]|uniref:cbb3-type cytochrome oxidase assembly protein CcoS n=1 Tax=unclassified Pseudovibrio TaxID=2627060 RepID=UPI000709F939|nr:MULTISPECIES: cbb3-type cytochrome oxidase assembly protein CcoS [unclassified Pseudovibrio]KZK85363.1 Cytochrome oxidase maturation protein cbb3-type [Pseudovibrio sp. Ad13]KZK91628.1 Cytochrome oxidase maturation protein cbb3-type [Pseudovibrio sp. Ad46]KZK91720.1 Cytochrome oxidase maturation protein cbb3-type [Pseudovibrio sp. W64]KZK97421.1 Cytochrome oxidase maturation protein cbb3-type [Pseudovibrio sp. Ad5]KZL03521.1 Cytochrome oxidase maturation protein cbb3-type [Pseudovibrio sp. 
MEVLIYLIPIALFLGGAGLVAFLWSLRSGQYDDMEGPKWRILDDGDLQENSTPVEAAKRKVS